MWYIWIPYKLAHKDVKPTLEAEWNNWYGPVHLIENAWRDFLAGARYGE